MPTPSLTHAQALAYRMYEEGEIDDYEITRDKFGNYVVSVRLVGDPDWSMLYDESEIDWSQYVD